MAFGLGAAVSADDRGGVDGRDPAADQPDQGPGAETLDGPGAVGAGAAEVLIEAGAVLTVQAAALPGDEHRPELVQHALSQRSGGLGEVGGEVLGEPQQHLTPVR